MTGLTLSVFIDHATLTALESRARARKQSLQECAADELAAAVRRPMHPFPLTHQAQRLLRYIEKFSKARGICPTYEEMALGLGLASKSGAFRLVSQLEERGAIRRLPNRARSVEIVGGGA